MAHAVGANSRDKLTMSRAEKTEAAWRLVVGTELSKSKIVKAANVADGTVGRMRRIRTELKDGHPSTDLSALTWHKAQRLAEGKQADENVDWDARIEQEAKEMAAKLQKAIGKRGHDRLEAFARALEIAYPRLPPFLKEHWTRLDSADF
jgi:hypothetical protein